MKKIITIQKIPKRKWGKKKLKFNCKDKVSRVDMEREIASNHEKIRKKRRYLLREQGKTQAGSM